MLTSGRKPTPHEIPERPDPTDLAVHRLCRDRSVGPDESGPGHIDAGPGERSAGQVPLVLVLVLALLTAVSPLSTDIYLPAFPELQADFGVDAPVVQLTLTTFMIGLAVGQLVIGPLSDRWGRRRPLIVGSVLCTFAGLVCALAPSIETLIAARFAQGVTGAAGIVIARAVIVDRSTPDLPQTAPTSDTPGGFESAAVPAGAAGEWPDPDVDPAAPSSDPAPATETARALSLMMTIAGAAPIVAPLLGGMLVDLIGWRGIFAVITGVCVLMTAGVVLAVPESLPVRRRRAGGLSELRSGAAQVLSDRRYLGWMVVFSACFAALFSYVSASSFVFQNVLGMSAGAYSVVFAIYSAGAMAGGVVSARLVARTGPLRLVVTGFATLFGAGLLILADVLFLDSAAAPMLILLMIGISALGLLFGNVTALALEQVPQAAGTGSAVLGGAQYGLGAVVAPLVGLGGENTAFPMALGMTLAAAFGLAVIAVIPRGPGVTAADPIRSAAGR